MNLLDIQNLYLEFLKNFPETLQPVISIGIAIFIVYSIIKVIKKDWIFIIALVVLLPASKEVLINAWHGIVEIIKFLVGAK